MNPTATRPRSGPNTGSELPATRLTTAHGTISVRRAWPVPGSDPHTLAIELDDAGTIRAGWWSAGQLRLLDAGEDPKLAALATAAQQGAVISHRPGKRAVVRSADDARYVKVVKAGKTGSILDGVRRAAAFSGPFRTPEVLGSTESTVTFAALQGQSLHEANTFTADQWRTAWLAVCAAWEESVAEPRSTAASAPVRQSGLIHRAEAEIAVLRHWYQLARPWLSDEEQAHQSVEHLAELLASLPQEQLRPAHRDLHDKQLLWSAQAGPGLLDVDTACLADPALDLGNLRAHALLRRRQGVWTAEQAETVTFCVDETAQRIGAPMPTVAVYEQSALLRLGFVYAVRPQYARVAEQLRELIRA